MSVGAPTLYWLVTPETITEGRFDPSRVGLSGYVLDDLKGGTADDNVALAADLLNGVGRPALRDAVCLNAGAALWLADLAGSIEDGFALARKTFEGRTPVRQGGRGQGRDHGVPGGPEWTTSSRPSSPAAGTDRRRRVRLRPPPCPPNAAFPSSRSTAPRS